MHLRLSVVLSLTAALPLALAACSGKSEEEIAKENNTYLPADAPPTAKERPILLDALTQADYEARLGSGPTCRFTSADGRELFVAAGPANGAAKGKGLLKLGGDFRTLQADTAGGIEAIQNGGRFSDGNVIAVIEAAGGQGDLTVAIADGNEARFDDGLWACGT